MSDIVDSLEEHIKGKEEKKEKKENGIRYEEIKELIDKYRTSENPLSDLAEEIKKSKEETGWKATSITYPAEWDALLEDFKALGERETGFRNLSLMINIAIIEFLLRHKSNPQPTLTDSMRLTLPSTIRSNFSEEFKNYLRNLPQDRAKKVMLKNAKYLALRAVNREKEKEGTEQQEKEKEKKSRNLVQEKRQEEYKKYVKALKYVRYYMGKGKFEKAQMVINDIPLNELREQHREMVKSWQKTIKQRSEGPIQLRELPKEDTEIGGKPTPAGKDEIFGEKYREYLKRLTAAEHQLEQGNRTKAKKLVEDLNITNAPGDHLADLLREIKEELGVKYG